MSFKNISCRDINENVFSMISDKWMLVTSCFADSNDLLNKKVNTMTASWGGFGHLWNKDVAFVFVRPTRYTYDFIEKSQKLTLSFFDESWREALTLCGRVSGRDTDKFKATGLKPIELEKMYFGFEQADLIISGNVIAKQDINPSGFLDSSIDKNYKNDYHRVYITEIISVVKKIN